MRLSLCLLLVTLALCFYEANAGACPSLVKELKLTVTGSPTQLRAQLAKYNATKDEVAAELEVKKCIDQMPSDDIQHIIDTLNQIVSNCQ
ncbi:secretoglobin family 1D member 2-like [Cynocephalus volans]|uniref:secretoglobin family 1D member 2-like n=1 Tax=Cynocephalus volans TaxID=110931 RepID=UPI002FC59972